MAARPDGPPHAPEPRARSRVRTDACGNGDIRVYQILKQPEKERTAVDGAGLLHRCRRTRGGSFARARGFRTRLGPMSRDRSTSCGGSREVFLASGLRAVYVDSRGRSARGRSATASRCCTTRSSKTHLHLMVEVKNRRKL